MFGDASSREYFRLTNVKGSFVLVKDQPNAQQIIDFIKINEVLPNEIKRPSIIKYSNEDGYLLQEDIGGKHLFDEDLKRKHFFEEAIYRIFDYQKINVNNFVNKEKSFDYKKLMFESDVAVEYLLKKHCQLECPEYYKRIFSKIHEVFQSNQVLCHRDYHSKNLMIHEDSLYHIDFQDAMIGPSLYDLVSFVEDPYYAYEEDYKKEFKQLFFENESFYSSFEEFQSDYNIIAFQRLFKAMGSYTFLNYEKEKAGYLQYLKPAMINMKSIVQNIKEAEFEIFFTEIEEALR